MLKQELIHSHIMMAIFCGWEPQKPNKEFPNGYLKLDEETVSNDAILEELPYQTDWNYLHAAWGLFIDANKELSHEEREPIKELMINVEEAILDNDQDLAFKELIRGINYINQLKLQET